MLKKALALVLLCSVILLSFCSFTPVKANADIPTAVNNEKVLEARFLNMLNHNFVYNDAFYNDEALLNDSCLALLEYQDGGFIADGYVKDYAFNMYGKIYDDLSGFNAELPKADGKFFVKARGYDLYEHSVLEVIDNQDGSFTVKTEVKIDYHFGETETVACETLFIENELSQFGFNILYSDIETALQGTLSV